MVRPVLQTKPMDKVTLEAPRSLHCAHKVHFFDNSDSALTIRMDVLTSLGSEISKRKNFGYGHHTRVVIETGHKDSSKIRR